MSPWSDPGRNAPAVGLHSTMSRTSTRIRGVVLASLVVLSAVGGTVTFASTASASVDAVDELSASDVDAASDSTTQTISFVLDDVDSAPANTTEVSVDLTDATDAGTSIDGVSASVTNDTGGYTVGTPTVTDGVVRFDATDATDASDDAATVTLTVTYDTIDVAPTASLDATVSSTGSGATASTTFDVVGREVGNGGTVYLGERDVDLTALDGSATTFVGVAGEADGTTASVADLAVADVTTANNFQPGGYDTDGDDAVELFVADPTITDLNLYLGPPARGVDVTNGSVTIEDTDTTRIVVQPQFDFGATEDVAVTVTDESGLEITEQVLANGGTAASGGTVPLDLSGQDAGEYTVTVEGADDLDEVSRSTTLTGRGESTTISQDEATVTRGNPVVATVTGGPGATKYVRIDADGLASDDVTNRDVFANTASVNRSAAFDTDDRVGAALSLGDDGEALVRINTESLDTATVYVEVADEFAGDQQDSAELTIEERHVEIASAPDVVRVGEEFDVEGTAPESDGVAAYAHVGERWELLAGPENPVDTDADGSYTLELAASSPLSLPGSYRVAVVTAEAKGLSGAANGSYPTELDTGTYGDLDPTESVTVRSVEGDLTARLSSEVVAAEVGDGVTVAGSALGQGSEVRVYKIGPRGTVQYRTPDVEDEQFSVEFAGIDTHGTHTVLVVGRGRDQEYAATPNEIDDEITGEETQQQAIEIVRAEYSGAGIDDQIVRLDLEATYPHLTIDDVTTNGQVAQGTVTVSGTSNREGGTVVYVEVLDGDGTVVAADEAEVNGSADTWSTTVDLSDAEPGAYTIRADDGEVSASMAFELVDSLSTPSETPFETATDTPTETPTDTPTETPTETATDTPTPTETGTSFPGFGVAVAIIALVAAALLAVRQD